MVYKQNFRCYIHIQNTHTRDLVAFGHSQSILTTKSSLKLTELRQGASRLTLFAKSLWPRQTI